MSLVLDNIYRVTLTFNTPDLSLAQNVFHYKVTIPDATVTPLQILGAIQAQLVLGFSSTAYAVSDQVSGSLIELAILDPLLGTFTGIASLPAAGFDGTNISDALPNGVAVLLKFFTAAARSQGRKYLVGFTENWLINNVVIPGLVPDLLGQLIIWAAAVVVGVGEVQPGDFSVNTNDTTPWSGGGVVGLISAYQRRRKPGVGL